MRFLTYFLGVYLVLTCCHLADAQIFRRARPMIMAPRSCPGGVCPVDQVQPFEPIAEPKINQDADTPLIEKKFSLADGVLVPTVPKKKSVRPLTQTVRQDDEQPENFGVEWDKIKEGSEDSRGYPISLWQAEEFAHGKKEYVRDLYRFVVIGTAEERKPVKDAWDKLAPGDKEKMAPWFVSADHWSLRDSETNTLQFKTEGHPTVYLLGPDGVSLCRQDGWNGDGDMEAIRKQLKKYDPQKDVDARRVPVVGPAIGITRVVQRYLPVALVCGVTCLVFSFITRRRS